MTDYKTMYHIMCEGASHAADVLSGAFVQTDETMKTLKILSKALDEAEQVYINTCSDKDSESSTRIL